MKTLDFNYRFILLLVAFIALSGMIVNGLVSPLSNSDGLEVETGSMPILTSEMKHRKTDPDKHVVNAPVKSEETIPVASVEVMSTKVKDFKPVFDEVWCKKHYPGFVGNDISLESRDIIIRDNKGKTIADYDQLCLRLAPVATEDIKPKTANFDDAYINVKGIGPLKIKAITFNYEAE